MSNAVKAFFDATYKNLTTPDASIVAIAGAIETDSNDSLLELTSLGQHGSNVGPVMLDSQSLRNPQSQGMRAAGILRMGIVCDQQLFGTNLVHGDQILNRFFESAQRLIMAQVSDVLAHKRLTVDHERDCVLQIGTDGQNWTRGRQLRHGARSIASCAANDDRSEHSVPGHRVIHSSGDGALSNQKSICNSRKAVQRFVIFIGDRFTRSIRTGHD